MKREYRIIESRPATQHWEYIVKAHNEQEALDKVLNGEIEAEETWVDEDDSVDSDFEVYSDDNK